MPDPRADPQLEPIDDVLPAVGDPPLRLLICGINPGAASARTNRHYAGPGNRFWPALAASGLVPGPLTPDDQWRLPEHGIGLTNLVARPTGRASEVTTPELRAGAAALLGTVELLRPAVVAVLGVTAYRAAFDRPRAARGPQPDRPDLWLLDNPSGLNAHAPPARMAAALADAGRAAGLLAPATAR